MDLKINDRVSLTDLGVEYIYDFGHRAIPSDLIIEETRVVEGETYFILDKLPGVLLSTQELKLKE